jgi:methionyl-tRNA formyltransferase
MKICYAIATSRDWHDGIVQRLREKFPEIQWVLLTNSEEFSLKNIKQLNCSRVFVPHWSQIIPTELLDRVECIIFHMTDLPFGRGGSPLQNLIASGYRKTKITALRATAELDAGPVYCKQDLGLNGTALEIFQQSSVIIESMIIDIISNNLRPVSQEGTPTFFKRRRPSDGSITGLDSPEKIYDYIRMLDCPGYPCAFTEIDHFILQLNDAQIDEKGQVNARVTFIPRK